MWMREILFLTPTCLFEDPVNLLRTVVVALDEDGVLDSPGGHLLASLLYRVRPEKGFG